MSMPMPYSAPYASAENREGFWLTRLIRAHPKLLLLLLSPGIPEYLSGSSSWAYLILNPPLFFLLLALNIALYFPGVLLVREAVIRWRKGWASVFLLGFAYAIVEEGLALRTLYNPIAAPVGNLGTYGHWLGVNWVWTAGILIFHSAFSIALPILLFRLAFPALKSRSLTSSGGIALWMAVLAFDSAILSGLVNYDPGAPVLLFSLVMVFVFVAAAHAIPADFLKASTLLPNLSPLRMAILGGLFFPSVLIGGALATGVNLPPIATAILEIVVSIILLRTVIRNVGSQNNQPHKTALGIGLVLPVVCFGIIASLALPLILVADGAFIMFTRRLWTKYQPRGILEPSLLGLSGGHIPLEPR